MLNLSDLNLVRPERRCDVVDKHNEPTGLAFFIKPKADEGYQKAFRAAQDKFSSGKKISAKERREINNGLLMARVSGWEWTGRAQEACGEPEFNRANLRSVLFEDGENSAAIRDQVSEAVYDDEDVFTDE